MKSKASLFAVTLLLASFPLFTAYDAFLKIDTIPGESTAPGHQGWMDIESFSWGATPATARTATSKCSLHMQRVKLSVTAPPWRSTVNGTCCRTCRSTRCRT